MSTEYETKKVYVTCPKCGEEHEISVDVTIYNKNADTDIEVNQ